MANAPGGGKVPAAKSTSRQVSLPLSSKGGKLPLLTKGYKPKQQIGAVATKKYGPKPTVPTGKTKVFDQPQPVPKTPAAKQLIPGLPGGPGYVKPTPLAPTSEKPVVKAPPPHLAPPPSSGGGGMGGQGGAPSGPLSYFPPGTQLFGDQTPQQLAQAALAPQYAQVASQTEAEQRAMSQFTQAMLAQLQGYAGQVGGYYDQARQAVNGYAQSAAHTLASLDPSASNNSLLAAAGASPAQASIDQAKLQDAFGGGAAALYGIQGALPAESLAKQGAAAQTYAASLPQIQGLASTQAMKNLLYQAGQQRMTIANQYPGLLSQYASAKAENAWKAAAFQQNQEALGVKSQVAQASASRISPGVSKVLGFASTANGVPITNNGKLIPVDANGKQGTPKVPTASQISSLVDAWRNGKVASVRVPAVDKNGNQVYDSAGAQKFTSRSASVNKLNYQQAYKRLKLMLPSTPDKQVRQYLNTAYPRGEQGRGWLSNEAQSALGKAGLTPRATVMGKGASKRGVLTLRQAQALRKAGLLPPGQATRDGFYVISSGF